MIYVDIEKNFGKFNLRSKFEFDNEVMGLLGASGSGKSLTLKCIAGIEKPDKGRIVLNDRVLFDSEKKINISPKDRKIGYSSLECLSLDPEMRDYIRPFLSELKEAAENLPRLENEDAGLMARGILVNLGEMDIKDLHGPEAYKKGLKLKYGRRAMVPLPN